MEGKSAVRRLRVVVHIEIHRSALAIQLGVNHFLIIEDQYCVKSCTSLPVWSSYRKRVNFQRLITGLIFFQLKIPLTAYLSYTFNQAFQQIEVALKDRHRQQSQVLRIIPLRKSREVQSLFTHTVTDFNLEG